MIAERLRIINSITPLSENDLQKGTFLCLFGTDKIPPHLGLIVNGKYYSASAKGSRVGEDVSLILRRVKQSTIPTLFIQLDVEFDFDTLIGIFNRYPKLKDNQTCLLPIKDCLITIGEDVSRVNFVYELMPVLQERSLISKSYSLFMEGGSFELATYTKEDIIDRILKLQETC